MSKFIRKNYVQQRWFKKSPVYKILTVDVTDILYVQGH